MRSFLPVVLLLVAFAACSDRADDPVEVTGTEVCTQIASAGLTSSEQCEDQASDPRVSGTANVSVVLERPPPTPMSGTIELVNEGGTWIGDWSGEITATRNHIIDAVLLGTGEYEGLEYAVRWEGADYPWTITGTIRSSG